MRCPFRMAALDHPDTCDPKCAWLVEVPVGDRKAKVCAVTLVGSYDIPRKAVNSVEEE